MTAPSFVRSVYGFVEGKGGVVGMVEAVEVKKRRGGVGVGVGGEVGKAVDANMKDEKGVRRGEEKMKERGERREGKVRASNRTKEILATAGELGWGAGFGGLSPSGFEKAERDYLEGCRGMMG